VDIKELSSNCESVCVGCLQLQLRGIRSGPNADVVFGVGATLHLGTSTMTPFLIVAPFTKSFVMSPSLQELTASQAECKLLYLYPLSVSDSIISPSCFEASFCKHGVVVLHEVLTMYTSVPAPILHRFTVYCILACM
jgi:hypothetical protein